MAGRSKPWWRPIRRELREVKAMLVPKPEERERERRGLRACAAVNGGHGAVAEETLD
jgi:hypothetical protein